MPETSTLRVGIVGAGANTRKLHIPNLQKQPGSRSSRSPTVHANRAGRAADEFGIPRVADHWREIVEDDGIDAVCIGTWPYLHASVTIAALEAGKHVLCEARMAMNASQAHAMLEAARANPHLTAQIVPAPHTLALDRTIVDMIGAGYIGDLVAVDAHVTIGSDFPAWDSPPHWRHSRDLSGNNVMMMGIWYEAMMRWTGLPSTVTALAQCVVRHRTDAQGRAAWPWRSPITSTFSAAMAQGGQMRVLGLDRQRHAPPTSVAIYGTEGTLKIVEEDAGDPPFGLGAGSAATNGCTGSTSRRRRPADGGSRRSSSTRCAASSR